MSAAIGAYLEDLEDRESSQSHIDTTKYRLEKMFPDGTLVSELSPALAQTLYDNARAKIGSVYSHRRVLTQSRTFCKWMVRKGQIRANPFADVDGVGKCKRGKEQLSIDESRTLMRSCLDSIDIGATATLVCLIMGLRASEVARISPRSIDDDGRVLRIDRAKTVAGDRLVEIPEVLRDRIIALANSPARERHWVSRCVRGQCKRAGVTVVGPQALRGTHATLATSVGATSQLVASTLGHASTKVTERHYTKPEAIDSAKTKVALSILEGGKR